MKAKQFYLTMLLLFMCSACTMTDSPYAKVGVGYKFKETDVRWDDKSVNHPISARLEVGFEYNNWTYGYSHHSQWLQGFPVDNDYEYSKHEVFVDYTWRFSQ